MTFDELGSAEQLARLGLHELSGIGPQLAKRLVGHFGSAAAVFAAGEAGVSEVEGIGAGLAERLGAGFDAALAARRLAAVETLGLRVICSDDPLYPPGFTRLRQPPFLVFCAGTWPCGERAAARVALVGTRHPDQRGIRLTREATVALVQRGFTIVSGGALGIDTAAHVAALSHHGNTIAVLAHGVDQAYPPQNRALFQQIREQGGALLSEFAPGTRPERGYFPRRNRLISGLSSGVVVVQCGAKSGALNTASYAKQAGIPVMAFPGRPQESLAAGPHKLLREGARLVESGADIASQLAESAAPPAQLGLWPEPSDSPHIRAEKEMILRHVVTQDPGREPLTAGASSLDPPSQALLENLDQAQPKHIDALALDASIPVAQATARLLELELDGWVYAHPGMHFTRL